MTAQELIKIAEEERPGIKYTANRRGDAVAAWHQGQWVMVAGKLITGCWATIGNLLVNGEPVNKPEDWIPVDGCC